MTAVAVWLVADGDPTVGGDMILGHAACLATGGVGVSAAVAVERDLADRVVGRETT